MDWPDRLSTLEAKDTKKSYYGPIKKNEKWKVVRETYDNDGGIRVLPPKKNGTWRQFQVPMGSVLLHPVKEGWDDWTQLFASHQSLVLQF